MHLLNYLPDSYDTLLDPGSDLEMVFLIKDSMLHIAENERFNWFIEKSKENISLYPFVYMVYYDTPTKNRTRDWSLFSEEQRASLRQICVERIQKFAEDNSILDQKNFSLLMFRWKDWGITTSEIESFITRVKSDPHNLLKFISGFDRQIRSESNTRNAIQVDHEINLQGLNEFLTREEILDFIGEIEKNKEFIPNEEESSTLELLRKAFQGPISE